MLNDPQSNSKAAFTAIEFSTTSNMDGFIRRKTAQSSMEAMACLQTDRVKDYVV
jgi:hypothetical protein